MSIILITPKEMELIIAKKAKEKRLTLNLSQLTLSKMSGVSYGVIKRFESTGQISLKSLLKLSLPLKALDEFKDLFPEKPLSSITIDDLIKDTKRKRGRK